MQQFSKLQVIIWKINIFENRIDFVSYICNLFKRLWKPEKNLLLNGIPVQCFTNWTITPTSLFQRNEKYMSFFVKYKFNISLLHLHRLQTKHTFQRLKMILIEFLSFQHTRPHKVYWQLQNQAGFYRPGGGNPKRGTKRKADCNKSYRSTECS